MLFCMEMQNEGNDSPKNTQSHLVNNSVHKQGNKCKLNPFIRDTNKCSQLPSNQLDLGGQYIGEVVK